MYLIGRCYTKNGFQLLLGKQERNEKYCPSSFVLGSVLFKFYIINIFVFSAFKSVLISDNCLDKKPAIF